MQNEASWISVPENLEENSLYSQVLHLLQNPEEFKNVLEASGCRCPGGCSGGPSCGCLK